MGTWGRRAAWASAAGVGAVALRDLTQRRHAILRNFPIIGHFRYLLEGIGPEIRQYLVTDNDSERPFNRDQRRWVYTSSKGESNLSGFGSDNNIEAAAAYPIIKQVTFPLPPPPRDEPVPVAKVLGEAHGRRGAFRMPSIVNLSAMSFGSLSGPAIEALNRGAAAAGCLQTTGEGGISVHHRHGAELVWQIGTGYFGCRDDNGDFSLERAVETAGSAPVRAVEVKLSQGAKAGLGGVVPGVKVTAEIAAIRGVPEGEDCISPPRHRAFDDVDGLIDFVEVLAAETGLPVGIKSAVGDQRFWDDLADRMRARGEGPDFVTVDGGEGGTGAAPFVFADHVSLPFRAGFPRVYRTFAERDLHEEIVFIGSGKLGFPDTGLLAMALGCDALNVGREAMLSIGCIQAQRCHSGRCPTGVATQSPWLTGGLDPTIKAVRSESYLVTLRAELARLAGVCGVTHPGLVDLDAFELVDHGRDAFPAREVFGYEQGWGLPSAHDRAALAALKEPV